VGGNLMAKAIRTVGTVVGAAVAIVGVATANPALTAVGVKIATYSNMAASAIDLIKPPRPDFGTGNPLQFQTNPQSALPYPIGRTRMSGVRIHAETYDATAFKSEGKQDVLAFGVLLGAGGPMQEIETFRADKMTVAFDGSGQATGDNANYMAQKVSLGPAGASALALSFGGAGFPGWTSAHKLSGIAHALWDLRYDEKGNHFGAGVPEPEWIGKWAKVYDPRKDSTYPGGSGSHRALNEATYEWSNNPALHALTWCLGRWQNGKRTLGIGAPVSTIRVADFVEAANVADANLWACGGVEWSTDTKWSTLKRMLQAGGAEPTMTGAMIGCRVNTPRVSIATVEAWDLLDTLTYSASKSRRDRFNTVIPRFRSEMHEWEVVSGTPVTVPDYVTLDGSPRTKEIDFPLVQMEGNGTGQQQPGQLAAYEIVNSREAGPIRFTTGPKFFGIKTGDCITLNVPEEGLVSQPVIIRSVSRDPATMKFTFDAETETEDKHDFALGASSDPPPTWEPTPPDIAPPTPSGLLWSLEDVYSDDGHPGIIIIGACEFPGADSVLLDYRKVGDPDWITIGKVDAAQAVRQVISPLDGDTSFEARVAYQSDNRFSPWLVLSSVTTPPSKLSSIDDGATRNVSRGAWAGGVAYADGDIVTYNGSSYLVTTAHTSSGGSPPPNANVALLAAAGASGVSAMSVSLSNPTASILTDADGNNGVFTNATGQVVVKYGGTDVTASATISEPSGAETNCTGDVNTATNTPVSGQAKGYYRVTAITADTARYRIRAVYDPGTGPIAQEVDFTLARQKKAASGTITADRNEITYDWDGTLNPASGQDVHMTFNKVNSAATVTWRVYDYAGNQKTPTSSYLTIAGDNATMSPTQFASARGSTEGVMVSGELGSGLTQAAHTIMRKLGPRPPQYFTVAPSRWTLRTDSAGALDPASQDNVFTVAETNLTGITYAWTLKDYAGNVKTPGTYLSGTTGTAVTMTGANFLAAAGTTGGVEVTVTPSVGAAVSMRISEVGDGANALAIIIKKSRDAITYNAQGLVWPASQNIDFTAIKQNLSGTVTFEVRDGANNLRSLPTHGTVVGDVLTMTADQFELARGNTQTVQVRAYIGSIEGFATVSGTPLLNQGDNEWPDPLLNTLDKNFSGGALAAPFSVQTNGITNGYKYANYVRVISTTSPTTEYFAPVATKIPVRFKDEKFWMGFTGGVGTGSGALMFGVYAKFFDIDGVQQGSTVTVGTSVGMTLANDWPQVNGASFQAPANAAYVEIGWWRDDHGTITSSQAQGVAPYFQRVQPQADITRTAYPNIAPVTVPPSGTVVLNADWKGAGLPAAVKLKFNRSFGGADVSSTATWSLLKNNDCGVSLGSTGLATVTPAGGSFTVGGAQLRVQSVYDTVAMPEVARIEVKLAPPPQPSGDSTIKVGNPTSFDLTATSYASETTIAGPLTINSMTLGTISGYFACVVTADAYGAGSAGFTLKGQYRAVGGGSWTDSTGTTVPVPPEDTDNMGTRGVRLAFGATGLTNNTDYEFRVIAYKTTAGHIYGQPLLFALNSGVQL
jgi:hypothetical protein